MPRFRCEECRCMVTRSPDTGLEYGHRRYGYEDGKERCSQRPDKLDQGIDPDTGERSA